MACFFSLIMFRILFSHTNKQIEEKRGKKERKEKLLPVILSGSHRKSPEVTWSKPKSYFFHKVMKRCHLTSCSYRDHFRAYLRKRSLESDQRQCCIQNISRRQYTMSRVFEQVENIFILFLRTLRKIGFNLKPITKRLSRPVRVIIRTEQIG